ncbi:MAG: hypothetical protein BWY21_01339 [Parcubacteria group bacterium ADurb.Bin216]|nr:MAG: hypothetical protein BWY21_01339 [Parcubacteria group bacterium ADurb.Bin216]
MKRLGKLRDATKALIEILDEKIEDKKKEIAELEKERAFLEKKMLEN